MPCRNHPRVETGLETCSRCEETFCDDCLVAFRGGPHCGPCKNAIVGMLHAGRDDQIDAEGGPTPWERRQELGTFAALLATYKGVLFSPTRFFAEMAPVRRGWDCLVPAMVAMAVGVGSLYALIGVVQVFAALASDGGAEAVGALVGAIVGVVLGVFCFVAFAVPIGIFLGAAFVHLWLHLTGTSRFPYDSTVRGYAYAYVPQLIPLVGGIWAIVTTVIMVRQLHRTSTGTAVMSVLWPLLLGVVLAVLFGAVVAIVAMVSATG